MSVDAKAKQEQLIEFILILKFFWRAKGIISGGTSAKRLELSVYVKVDEPSQEEEVDEEAEVIVVQEEYEDDEQEDEVVEDEEVAVDEEDVFSLD